MDKYPTPLILLITIVSFVYACQSAAYAQTPRIEQSEDTFPPTITTPNDPVIAEATGPLGAIVSFDVSATDEIDGNIVPQCIPSSGSNFRMDETTVNCTAIDEANNLEEKSFEVRVHDTIPPTTAFETAKVSWMGQIENNEINFR